MKLISHEVKHMQCQYKTNNLKKTKSSNLMDVRNLKIEIALKIIVYFLTLPSPGNIIMTPYQL